MPVIEPFVSYSREISACADYFKHEAATQVQRGQMIPLHESMSLVAREKPTSVGAQRMDAIISYIESVPGYELSIFQRMCLQEILPTIAPLIFGDDTQGMIIYFRRFGWTPRRTKQVFLETARRSGKTDILTLVTAAVMRVYPNFTGIAWSLFNKTADLFGATVYKWLTIFGATNVRRSPEHVIYEPEKGDKRVLVLVGAQNPEVRFLFLQFPGNPQRNHFLFL